MYDSRKEIDDAVARVQTWYVNRIYKGSAANQVVMSKRKVTSILKQIGSEDFGLLIALCQLLTLRRLVNIETTIRIVEEEFAFRLSDCGVGDYDALTLLLSHSDRLRIPEILQILLSVAVGRLELKLDLGRDDERTELARARIAAFMQVLEEQGLASCFSKRKNRAA